MSDILAIDDLSIGVKAASGQRVIVRNLSFAVKPGEVMALVGESGSGKTMTARAIPRLLPDGAAVCGGRILFDGQDVARLSDGALRKLRGRRIAMIFQEPMVALNPALTIGRQLMEAYRLHYPGRGDARVRALEMLDRLQVAEGPRRLGQYPHELSGGLRQRVMIAAALLPAPDLILADEPTTALDAISQGKVMELLADLARESRAAMLLITHDLGVVADVADRMLVMKDGEAVEAGDVAACLRRPQHPYTQRLLEALPRTREAEPRPETRAEMPWLSLKNVRIAYPGRRSLPWARAKSVAAVDGISLNVARGECVAIVGESGSGKTTLGRAILGLTPLSGGTITLGESPLSALSPSDWKPLRARVQFIFQDPYSSLNPRLRIGQIVGAGLKIAGMPREERARRVAAILEEVGLAGDFAARFPHQLSGGQRQRVGIARALVLEPELVVADEPVSALDLSVQAQVLALLKRLQAKRGFAMLFITHNLPVVSEIADRVIVMKSGCIVDSGRVGDLFAAATHPYTRALLAASPFLSRDTGSGEYVLRRLA